MNDTRPRTVQARWIVPVEAEPIRNGLLRIVGDRIDAVAPAGTIEPAADHEDLGDAIILPGLVNAHCHLELTGLKDLLPREAPMDRWLGRLVRLRRGRDRSADAAEGAAALLATGCTLVGDIGSDAAAWPALAASPIRAVCFAEVLGVGPLAAGALGRLRDRLASAPAALRYGVSPHAPYTTSEPLTRRAVRFALERDLPLTTHLAETPAERRFLRTGGGPMLRLLRRAGAIDHTLSPPGISPIDFAERTGLLAAGAALAHVNDVTDAELDRLAETDATVVVCPRSNAFFGRGAHRYPEMLERGIVVALGSDSLASNDSLDMLAEMRAIWAERRVSAPAVLHMATLAGAKALGMDAQVGSLVVGKQADWIALASSAEDQPLATLLADAPARPMRVEIGGRRVTTPAGASAETG